ncbi:DMT family transporter [Aquimarina sp. AD1]|uniref:DMT family transporter n=1 Tax=Aquimarina sp. (strain AD1) TaxID=1714848 RepID=UPI000E52FA60|nr:DMT family transporter [Aquimarina sp. AD1]AXT57500.1 DMT family transporter [Aquimarina sp. AD1]RKN35762.1 DMT family transporter [Aquimarina sp. AD1]
MDKRTAALLAAFGASLIYAINHTLAKGVMPTYIKPFGFILLRVIGAAALFWLASIWAPKQKIDRADWLRIFGCAIFGMVINMLMFFKGLQLSTPINSSVMITISPILVFVLSAIFLSEKITWLRTVGILLGFSGALGLILFGSETRQDAPNIPLGNILFIVNAASYAIYLVLVKPLTSKYHSFTLMKWFFLIGVIINFPITISEFSEVQWTSLPYDVIWKMAFVVIGTTFFTYLLNVFALKTLKASTIGAFIYLQPLLAISFAMAMGADSLNAVKIISALLVFLGVYLVTKKTKKLA